MAPASAACGASEPGDSAGSLWGKVTTIAGAVGLSAPESPQGTKGPRGAFRGAGVLRRVVEGRLGQSVLCGRGQPRPDKAAPAPLARHVAQHGRLVVGPRAGGSQDGLNFFVRVYPFGVENPCEPLSVQVTF